LPLREGSGYDLPVTGHSFHHRHRVTYSECTLGNHVYYARYLDLLEEARGEFMRSAGIPFLALQSSGYAFPVLECHLQYRHPARYDDVLDVELWLNRLERVRLEFGYRITHVAGKVILEARTLHVAASLDEKPRRLPEELATLLRPFLASPREPALEPGKLSSP
jgi:acyl-CoA thioester hydrolase